MTKQGSTMWHGFGLQADPKPFYLGMRKAAEAVKRFSTGSKQQGVTVEAVSPNWMEAVRIGNQWRISLTYAGSDKKETIISDRLPHNPEGRGLKIESEEPGRIVWVASP